MAMPFGGLRVLTDVNATMDGDPVEVPRTWRERLCLTSLHAFMTQPFEPWRKTRTVIPRVPAAFILSNNTVLMHPQYLEQMRTFVEQIDWR